MESLADNVKNRVDHKSFIFYGSFSRGYTDIFTHNIYATIDYTYHNFRGLIQNKSIVVIKGDNGSSRVIMKKLNYVGNLETMF